MDRLRAFKILKFIKYLMGRRRTLGRTIIKTFFFLEEQRKKVAYKLRDGENNMVDLVMHILTIGIACWMWFYI